MSATNIFLFRFSARLQVGDSQLTVSHPLTSSENAHTPLIAGQGTHFFSLHDFKKLRAKGLKRVTACVFFFLSDNLSSNTWRL